MTYGIKERRTLCKGFDGWRGFNENHMESRTLYHKGSSGKNGTRIWPQVWQGIYRSRTLVSKAKNKAEATTAPQKNF